MTSRDNNVVEGPFQPPTTPPLPGDPTVPTPQLTPPTIRHTGGVVGALQEAMFGPPPAPDTEHQRLVDAEVARRLRLSALHERADLVQKIIITVGMAVLLVLTAVLLFGLIRLVY